MRDTNKAEDFARASDRGVFVTTVLCKELWDMPAFRGGARTAGRARICVRGWSPEAARPGYTRKSFIGWIHWARTLTMRTAGGTLWAYSTGETGPREARLHQKYDKAGLNMALRAKRRPEGKEEAR